MNVFQAMPGFIDNSELIPAQRWRKASHYYLKSMGRGGYRKPKTASEMFRDCIRPYNNLYELYMSCKDADIYIRCKDKYGREIVFTTGLFAQIRDRKLLRDKKLNKV